MLHHKVSLPDMTSYIHTHTCFFQILLYDQYVNLEDNQDSE